MFETATLKISTPFDLLLQNFKTKNLDEAKDEIKRLRELASNAFNGEGFKQNETKGGEEES